MRRVQVVTAACAALMWTAALGVPTVAAQAAGSGGSAQGGSQGGSSTGATAAGTSGIGGRDAQTGSETTGTASANGRSTTANDLQQFVQKAAIANMAEIQLGQLAAQHAENPQVKQFAQMMVDEHTKALEQLRSVAGSQSVQVPSEIDGKNQKLEQKLSKLQGAEFDRAYMDAMVDAHKDAEKLLKSRAGKGASASASNMGDHHGAPGTTASGSTAGAGTSSSGTSGTSGGSATGTSGQSGTGTMGTSGSSSSGTSATAGAAGSTSGSTETGTSSVGTPGTTGTSGSSSSSMGSTGSMGAGSTPTSADEWASMTLPKVRAHLEQARSLEDQIKQSGRSNNGGNNNGTSTGGPRSGDHGAGSGAGQSGSGTSGSSSGGGTTPPQQ